MAAFGASVALVLEEINRTKQLHRSARAQRLSFAIDVCLVAHGVRTGYLVDALSPPKPSEAFRDLLIAIRRRSAVFEAVALWHHAPTTQSFLVHTYLLQNKIATLLSGATRECLFVKLDRCPSMSRGPPNALREALQCMQLVVAEFPNVPVYSLSEVYAEDILIPLAAVVIDYPVAYFPTSKTQTSFLEGVPLDVYTVSFKWTIGDHVLLTFSCPQTLASDHVELSQGTMVKKLRAKFATVLEHVGASVSVAHRTETLDRVAL